MEGICEPFTITSYYSLVSFSFAYTPCKSSVIYDKGDKIIHTTSLPAETVLRLLKDLHSKNRATFVFTESRCLLINTEMGGPDWLSIAGKYDKNVEGYVEKRDEVLKQISSGELSVIKVTICAEALTLDRESPKSVKNA